MATITDTILYLYGHEAEQIHLLKADAYRSTTQEKYAYVAPDGKSFRSKRPAGDTLPAGWKFAKVKYERVESHMSPKHQGWEQYQRARRRATLLLTARALLKASDGCVPEKREISQLLRQGSLRHHARTAHEQKSLAYAAYRSLRKLANRMEKQPERFAHINEWQSEREQERLQAGTRKEVSLAG